MPFAGHNDLYSTYAKSAFLAFDGSMFPSKFAVLWLYFHAGVLKFYSFFWPGIAESLPADPVSMHRNLQSILGQSHILRLTFLLKLPYLVLDFVGLGLFLTFFKNHQQRFVALIAWVFNPYSFFALYVYGRNEILAVIFLVSAIWLLKKSKLSLASVVFGLTVAVRLFTLILLPVFVVMVGPRFFTRVKHVLLILLPISLSVLIRILFADAGVDPISVAPLSIDFFAPLALSLGHGQSLYVLPMLLLILSGVIWFQEQLSLDQLWAWSTSFLYLSLSLMFFHPHYFAWLLPFQAWMLAAFPKQRSRILMLYAIQFVGWLMTLLYWGGGVTLGLLGPVSPNLFKELGSPLHYIGAHFGLFDVVGMGRVLIAASHGLLCLLLWPKLQPAFQVLLKER